MTSLGTKILYVLGLCNLVIMIGLGYILFAPVNLAVVYNEPFPVYPPEVQRGESITFTIEFEKDKHYEVISHRSIICADGNLVTLADATSKTNAPIGRHSASISIKIPEKVSDGNCYIELKNTYLINPLRTEHRTMRTQDFFIYDLQE